MLLFTRNIGFKFIGVNEPVLGVCPGVCPGVLDRETVTSFSGLMQPIIAVKVVNGTYGLCVCVYLTLIQKENSR